MTHEIEIDGCLNVPTTVSLNDVVDEFLAFIENRGWYFGGGFNKFKDDHYESIDVREED